MPRSGTPLRKCASTYSKRSSNIREARACAQWNKSSSAEPCWAAHIVTTKKRQCFVSWKDCCAGLPWPPDQDVKWWSKDKKQQERNRAIYHGLRLSSLRIINKLIGEALQAADPDALRTARRFAFRYRERIYRACALSRRALQLAETFPVLACAIYCHHERRNAEAVIRVEQGARLREIAAIMDVPTFLRKVKPGAAHLVRHLECYREQACAYGRGVRAYMPDALPHMRIWLRAVEYAYQRVNEEFAEWVAAHVMQIPGGANEKYAVLSDLADWVRVGEKRPERNDGLELLAPYPLAPEQRLGHQFIVRPFDPSMSLRTVMKLSADWHEAVANNLDGPEYVFPAPWFPATTVNGIDIIPITNSADLYREGHNMHHCVGNYANRVQAGHYYVYSICRDGKHLASAGLSLVDGKVILDQLRGPCNASVPGQITSAVKRWVRNAGVHWS